MRSLGQLLLQWLIEQGDRVPSNLPIDGHSFRRVEVLTGTPRRRRWSDAEKAAIVAESVAPGAKSSEIALRHGLHRNQLYDWRRQFRSAAVADGGLSRPIRPPPQPARWLIITIVLGFLKRALHLGFAHVGRIDVATMSVAGAPGNILIKV